MRSIQALLFAVAMVTAPAFGATPELSGTWVMDADASESVEAILKAQGLGMIERKVAANLAVTQVITVKADTVSLEIRSSRKTDTQTLHVDGTPRVVSGDLGDSTVSHVWSGAALETTSTVTASDGAVTRTTITRSVADDGQTMHQHIEMVLPDGTSHEATRVFRRQ